MFLFGPPDIEKMKAQRDINGLKKALEYKNDETIRSEAARALDELGYYAEVHSPKQNTAQNIAINETVKSTDTAQQKTDAFPNDIFFRMKVDDVFFIRNRGIVSVGRIEQGTITEGAKVEIQNRGGNKRLIVTQLEMFRKVVKQAGAGDSVGLLFKDAIKGDVQVGDILINVG